MRSLYAALEGLGGVTAACSLPLVLLVLFRDVPPGGGEPLPLSAAVTPAVLGGLGVALFVLADRRLEDARPAEEAPPTPPS